MLEACFSATRLGNSGPVTAFSAAITRIKCPRCSADSSAEYVVWGDRSASGPDKEEAIALLARLVEADHPGHTQSFYPTATLQELREGLWQKLAHSLL